MQGLHLTADLFGCRDPGDLMRDAAALQRHCETIARQAGLQVVGGQFHQFEGAEQPGGGVTGMVLLAESHLAVHTWPERAAATLDVYVCNFRGDNSARARQVCEALIAQLQPERCEHHTLWRGGRAGAPEQAVPASASTPPAPREPATGAGPC